MTQPVPAQRVARRIPLHSADVLLPVAAGLWVWGVSRTRITGLGPYGLLPLLPLVFYVGVGLLVISAVTELVRPRLSRWRMTLHAVMLTVMLYVTAPLVYQEGRYSWLYKTIGVVQYINVHGKLNRSIDIYQNWPGFFAFTAWFSKVAGVSSPLAYAKWAQFVFELAALPFLYLIYRGLALTARQRWLALLIVLASNWIGQDYFSPQALGTVVSLGIMAIAMRWLFVAKPDPGRVLFGWRLRPRRPWVTRLKPAPLAERVTSELPEPDTVPLSAAPLATTTKTLPLAVPEQPPADPPNAKPGRWARFWYRAVVSQNPQRLTYSAIIVAAFSVLVFTHQLSPYMLIIQLAALAVFGMLEPRWLPLALLAVALGYLMPRFSYVNSHYGLLKSLGNLFNNATPPALTRGSAAPSQQVIQFCAEALSIGMWILALIGAWRKRRSGHVVLALVLLAFSPMGMLAMQAYGHEGILRVYLFSLPWAAALAAMAIVPSPARVGRPARSGANVTVVRLAALRQLLRRARRAVTAATRPLSGTSLGDGLRSLLVLGLALALFFPSFFGDDSFNYMSPNEVNTLTSFFSSAPAGIVYSPFDNAPFADTYRYNLYPRTVLFGYYGMLAKRTIKPNVALTIAEDAWRRSGFTTRAYFVLTPSMIAYNQQYQVTPERNIATLQSSLTRSRLWKLLVHRSGVLIYALAP